VLSPGPASLAEPLQAVQRLLGRFNDQGMVIGGVAASLLGRPRLTVDIDAVILISSDELPALVEAAAREGIVMRIPDGEAFARENHILLLRHLESGIPVDISLGMLPFEREAVERSVLHDTGAFAVRLPTPEDLIILKAVAHRPQDLLDIEAVIEANPNLDRERIRSWVRQFAEALDMPEVWADIAPWF
jgi:hypothetical protein